jgi:Uma2 family endonuclease
MGLPLQKDGELFTYGHYLSWPDEERWELIDGIPFDMSTSPSPYHQEISIRLSTAIHTFLEEKGGKCKAYNAPLDVRLPEKGMADEDTLSVVQPDILVVCDPEKIDEKGCKGAPDFIAEILSPATAKKDMNFKLRLYEKHAVPEYWIIQPETHMVMVYKLNGEKKYGHADTFFKDDTISLNIKDTLLEIPLESVFKIL